MPAGCWGFPKNDAKGGLLSADMGKAAGAAAEKDESPFLQRPFPYGRGREKRL